MRPRARRGPVVPVSPCLADFLDRWLKETVRPGLSPATASNYEVFVRLYIVPDLGLTQALREDLVSRNVAALVRVPVPGRRRPPCGLSTMRGGSSSRRAREGTRCMRHTCCSSCLGSGGQVLGLAWEDVDLEGGEARMAVLRHSKIALTMEVYGQVSAASTRCALHLLGGQLGHGTS